MAEAKDVRLKTHPLGGVYKDMIYQRKDAKGRYVGGRYIELRPGTVFLCDAEKAARLLAIRPEIVLPTDELTEEEQAKKEAEDKEALKLLQESARKDAKARIEKREDALAKLEASLKKSKPLDLQAEAKKRGIQTSAVDPVSLKSQDLDPDALLASILEDERKKLETADAD